MKGQKQKDDIKMRYITDVRGGRTSFDNGCMHFTYLDLFPLLPTRENVMKYLAESGWILGLIISYRGDHFAYLDDYILEIFLMIFERIDKLIDIYEERGILAFCGYIKMIVFTNTFSEKSAVYKKVCYFKHHNTYTLDDTLWNELLDTYDFETEDYYKRKR